MPLRSHKINYVSSTFTEHSMQSPLAPRGVILRGFANSLDRPQNKNASHTESSMDRRTTTVRQLAQVCRPTPRYSRCWRKESSSSPSQCFCKMKHKTITKLFFFWRKRSIIRGLSFFARAPRNLTPAKSEGWLYVLISFSVLAERPQDVNKCLIMQPNEYIHSDVKSTLW